MLYYVPKIIFSWKIACHFLWHSDITSVMWDTDDYNYKITIPILSLHKS